MRSAFYAQCLPVHTIYCTKHMLIYFHWVGLQNTCVGPNPVQTAVNKPDPSFCRLGGVCSLWVLVEMTNFPIRSYKFWFGNDFDLIWTSENQKWFDLNTWNFENDLIWRMLKMIWFGKRSNQNDFTQPWKFNKLCYRFIHFLNQICRRGSKVPPIDAARRAKSIGEHFFEHQYALVLWWPIFQNRKSKS